MASIHNHPIGQTVLEAKNITKVFPGVKALSNVDIEVRSGEVLALLGENGAGKSTLIKILSGVYSLDGGEILLKGESVSFNNPGEATDAGIGIIHQELNNVETVSVAENLFMGNIPKKGIRIDYPRMYSEAYEMLKQIGVEDIDPKVNMGTCSVAQKQLIEIAKVLSNDIDILIMDEPTSALNDTETEHLLNFVHNAANNNIGVIYITHLLDEIFEIADRVMVLRDGVNVGELDIKDASKEKFISLMAGRTFEDLNFRKSNVIGDVILDVESLTSDKIKDISFHAKKGEVLGIYGLMGSGHQDIGPAIFGQDIVRQGTVKINDEIIDFSTPNKAISNGIAYIPAERKTEGLILGSSVELNISAALYNLKKEKLVNPQRDNKVARKWIEKFGIKTPSPKIKIDSLSGGNQQKVILSKWLELNPKVLILNEPTRGIDVSSKAEIYKILDELCSLGLSIVMVTSEMEELLTMADRVMVMNDGKISAELEGESITQQNIIRLAMGQEN